MNRYVKELSEYLTNFAIRCRAARWLGALFHVRVCADIVEDVAKVEAKSAEKAYTSEQHDREGIKVIDELHAELIAAINASDLPRIKRAITRLKEARRLILASAEQDREIGELLTA